MTVLTTGNKRAAFAVRGDDLYETPAVAVETLLEVEPLPHCIWEPSVGRGAIARILESAGHSVVGTDLVDYGVGYPGGRDFLFEQAAPAGVEAIVTNPLYKLANQFVARAMGFGWFVWDRAHDGPTTLNRIDWK